MSYGLTYRAHTSGVHPSGAALNPLARATWLLFDRQGNLSPLVQSGATSMGWLFDSTGTLKARPHNLLLWSEQFDNASWLKTNATVQPNATAASGGATTADKLVADTTSATHFVRQGLMPVVAGATYTFSVEAKQAEYGFVAIRGDSNSGVLGGAVYFSLGNGAVTQAAAGVTASSQNLGNGWYRLSVTAVATGSDANARPTVYLATAGAGPAFGQTFTGDGTSGIFIWGAQLNQGELQPYYRTGTYNLLQFTEAFENAAWTKNAVNVTQNAVTAPDGTVTADLLKNSTLDATHYTTQTVAPNILPDSTVATYSVSLKAETATFGYVRLRAKSGTFFSAMFDLTTGTVVSTSVAGLVCGAIPQGDGWFRCYVSRDVGTGANNPSGWIYCGVDANDSGTTEDVGVYAWGAQLVQGSDPLPYEPILGTTPTPAAFFGPRVSYDPAVLSLGPFLLAEEARTNSIRNNTMQGAVAGGAAPANWTVGTAHGLSASVVLTGVAAGIPFVRIAVAGTATSVGPYQVSFAPGNQIAAAQGQNWTESLFLRVHSAPTPPNNYRIRAQEISSSSVVLSNNDTVLSPTEAALERQRFIGPIAISNPSTAFVRPALVFGLSVGVSYDFTIDIGLPELSQGVIQPWSPPILTYDAAVTRSADNNTVNLAGTGYNVTESTVYADCFASNRVPDRVVFDIGAGGAFGTTAYVTLTSTNTALNPSIAPLNISSVVAVTDTSLRLAAALRRNDCRIAAAGQLGGLDVSCEVPTNPTTLTLGRGGWSGAVNPLNGGIRQLAIIPQRVSDSALQRLTRI